MKFKVGDIVVRNPKSPNYNTINPNSPVFKEKGYILFVRDDALYPYYVTMAESSFIVQHRDLIKTIDPNDIMKELL